MDILRSIETKITEKQETQISTQETFAELADKYGDPVYKFCRSLAYSKEDADDLFQETFLKAMEQPLKITGSDNPQNFLFTAALYIWKSRKRKYARRSRIAPVEPLNELHGAAASIPSAEEEYMAEEQLQAVRELVAALPEKLRVPVVMHYNAEMGVAEIASALKIPAGTVKSRLFTARKIIEKGLMELEK